jgi:glyceraldehyde 3-phosphate dehydrogenase
VTIRVAINGFGRIGRLTFRNLMERSDEFEVVAVNDLTDNKTLATLLKYDSIHGRYPGTVEYDENSLSVDGKKIVALAERDPSKLPWKEHKIDVVIESTGFFTARAAGGKPGYDSHLEAGAKKVVLSAPAKDGADLTCVMGVNDDKYDPEIHRVVTAASCTTNCLAPAVKVIHETFGIRHGSMTTVHDITNTQVILDAPSSPQKPDLRRSRACGMSLIPTTTGSAKAITAIFPELTGKLNGHAIRVPLANASLTDMVFELEREVTVEEVNAALKEAADGPLAGILGYEERPLVSIDYRTDPRSSIIDALSTMVINGTQLKLYAWYDNEWGYANRTAELARLVGQMDQKG